jgi:hypothetical protein
MSDMELDRWTLTVEFDSLATALAAGSDLDADLPLGEAAGFYAYLRQYWDGMLPEELDKCTRLEGDTVTATSDIIDGFDELLAWVISYTVPKRVELAREADRSLGHER